MNTHARALQLVMAVLREEALTREEALFVLTVARSLTKFGGPCGPCVSGPLTFKEAEMAIETSKAARA